ncbi:MAG TPA: LLM class flavin-dependent oxidoreductase [Mycobacterium sp.]|jgi:alkanesulfonate monooxygenase SsuD/methylene tetrahydromethanopterin reductase-like flavin-dependent oxidoreductase (luciferase family)|nr:LLM class flavin-dependent oxidoreductase [Mycobacterium sp.]
MTTSAGVGIGAVFRPSIDPARLAGAARAADAAGLDELWLWEDCFLAGGISAAAIALANSETLTVGLGVLPVPMRNVAVTAMEIATLDRAYPGRVRVGLGHGVQDWMAQIGEKVASPMTLLREYVTVLSGLLAGERVTFDGRYVTISDVGLDWPPSSTIGLLIGAERPRTLELSGEIGSGTVITGGTSPDELRAAGRHIDAGRAKSAASHMHSTVVYLICGTGSDAAQQARDEVEFWKLDPSEDRAVHGSAEDIAAGTRRWIDAGADTIVFQPRADADFDAFVDVIGRQVRPLIAGAQPTAARPASRRATGNRNGEQDT